MKTKQKIITKSLEMFNERGIEYVGLREIAAILNMRVSNITYYFPTKDDLVNTLSLELNQLNSQLLINENHLTIEKFLNSLKAIFYNHAKYRCLLLSVVHLMEQNKAIALRYKGIQKDRNSTLRANISMLIAADLLAIKEDSDRAYLVSTIAIIARFWISEAAVSIRHLQLDDQINHYIMMIGRLLLPYATPTGEKELFQFFEALEAESP